VGRFQLRSSWEIVFSFGIRSDCNKDWE